MNVRTFISIEQERGNQAIVEVLKGFPEQATITVHKATAGKKIMTFGKKSTDLALILSGYVCVTLPNKEYGDLTVDHIGPMRILGEQEYFLRESNSVADAVAETDLEYAVLQRDDYEKWLASSPKIAFERARAVVTYLTAQVIRTHQAHFSTGRTTLADFLVRMYEQGGIDGRVLLKLQRDQIAQELGVSVRTVNREIGTFDKNKYIERYRGKIVLFPEGIKKLRQINQHSQKQIRVKARRSRIDANKKIQE